MVKRPVFEIDLADWDLALRLLNTLILDWDLIPSATQGMLIRDAVLKFDAAPDATELAAALMSFINRYKDRAAQA